MHPDVITRSCSILLLSLTLAAQEGTAPAPAAPPATQAPAAKGDELRKAFVDADGGRRTAIAAAADKVLAADKAGRSQFMATLRAIAAVAPPPAPVATPTPAPSAGTGTTPAPDAGTGSKPAPTPPPKPMEFADDIKKLMADAIGADAKAQKDGLDRLVADKDVGTKALTQLNERGRAVLARCVSAFLRKKIDSNAIFAGQYAELRDFHPEVTDLLLRWAKEAPREVANPETFRTACLRALRDTLSAEQANDRVRADLKEIVGKAQQGRNQDFFVTAVCALQQYGDSSLFDKMKEGVQKQAETGTDEQKAQATNMLAELHYQARKYEDAANYYKAFVAIMEKSPEPAQGMPTFVYNTACSLALADKKDEAMQYLEKALEISAKSDRPLTKVLIDTDHDIESLRQDPRFTALYEKHFGKGKPAK